MVETIQKGVFLMFESPTTKTQKRPNTEPQGVPEAVSYTDLTLPKICSL